MNDGARAAPTALRLDHDVWEPSTPAPSTCCSVGRAVDAQASRTSQALRVETSEVERAVAVAGPPGDRQGRRRSINLAIMSGRPKLPRDLSGLEIAAVRLALLERFGSEWRNSSA
jgi:hypothetical protein